MPHRREWYRRIGASACRRIKVPLKSEEPRAKLRRGTLRRQLGFFYSRFILAVLRSHPAAPSTRRSNIPKIKYLLRSVPLGVTLRDAPLITHVSSRKAGFAP